MAPRPLLSKLLKTDSKGAWAAHVVECQFRVLIRCWSSIVDFGSVEQRGQGATQLAGKCATQDLPLHVILSVATIIRLMMQTDMMSPTYTDEHGNHIDLEVSIETKNTLNNKYQQGGNHTKLPTGSEMLQDDDIIVCPAGM